METKAIAALISDTRASINKHLSEELKRRGIEGLAPSHGAILFHLFNNDQVTMKDVALAVRRDKSTVTSLVAKLVSSGYVEKVGSSHDLRTIYVNLTEKGKRLQPLFEEISAGLIGRIWRGVDATEQDELVRILKKIRSNFH